MSDFAIFELVIPVIAPVFVGWLAVRVKALASADAKALSSAYLYIFLPALLIEHLAEQNLTSLFDGRFILGTAGLMLGIYGFLLLFHALVLRRPLDRSSLAAFAGSKFNAVVVGLPLLLIAIGRQAVTPVIINLVLGYLTIYPLTLVLLELSRARQNAHAVRFTTALTKAVRHAAMDPLIVSTAFGLLLAGMHMTLPEWLNQTLSTLGSAAVPVPLVAVGMTICGSHFGEDASEIVWMSAMRVIAGPLLAIAAAKFLNLSPVYAIALVISFSLPTAKMAFALAEEHGVYIRPMAGIVTVTTVSTIAVYPAFIWLCEHLWPGVIASLSLRVGK